MEEVKNFAAAATVASPSTNFRFLPSFNSIINHSGLIKKFKTHDRSMTDDHDETGVMWLWIFAVIMFIIAVALALYIALCMCGCCFDDSKKNLEKKD